MFRFLPYINPIIANVAVPPDYIWGVVGSFGGVHSVSCPTSYYRDSYMGRDRGTSY